MFATVEPQPIPAGDHLPHSGLDELEIQLSSLQPLLSSYEIQKFEASRTFRQFCLHCIEI
jgi:hypothetical protein